MNRLSDHVRWGFVYRAENDIVRACVVVVVLGLLGMYAVAAVSWPLIAAELVLVALVVAVLARDGRRVGPPSDDDEPTFIG